MFDLDLGPGIGGANNHFTELLFRLQPLRQPHRVGKLRSRRCRLSAELTPRHDHTLGAKGIHDFRHGNAHLGQPVRFDPDAHGVIACTDDVDPPDAPDA